MQAAEAFSRNSFQEMLESAVSGIEVDPRANHYHVKLYMLKCKALVKVVFLSHFESVRTRTYASKNNTHTRTRTP